MEADALAGEMEDIIIPGMPIAAAAASQPVAAAGQPAAAQNDEAKQMAELMAMMWTPMYLKYFS